MFEPNFPESSASPGSHRSRADKRTDPPRKQSFVRGDSTRKALHRRTPSAPSTPRLDHDRNPNAVNGQHKASSQPRLDSLPSSPNSDSSLLTSPVDTSLGIDIDAAIKARLQQMALQCRSARSSDSSPRSPEKSLVGGGGGRGETEKRKVEFGNGVVELQSSPGSHRRHEPVSPVEPARFFVSRYHDYAEILSDEEGGRDGSAPSSTTDMQELVEKLDSKLSSASRFYRHEAEDSSEPEAKHAKLEPERADSEKVMHVTKRAVERVPAASGSSADSPPSTQVVRRRAEWIPADSARTAGQAGMGVDFPELTPRVGRSRDAALPPIPQNRTRHPAQTKPGLLPQGGSMSKCLSVPSDIARSLENITASQSDLLSSVTISELSQSINSFCAGTQEESPPGENPRWRRSTSLDSLEAESSLCRTLRAINAQMDSAFHEKVELAIQLEEEGYSRHGEESSSLTPLHISEDNLTTPTAVHETHFPTTPDTPTAGEKLQPTPAAHPGVRETVPRSVSDSRDLGREGVSAAMSQSYPAPDREVTHHPDYAVVTKRQSALKADSGSSAGSQRDFPDYAFISKRQAVCIGDSDFGPQQGNFADWESFSEDHYPTGVSSQGAAAAADPSAQQSSGLENAHTDSLMWSGAGETIAETSHILSRIPQPSSRSEKSRVVADATSGERTSRSNASTPRSDANTPRTDACVPRVDSSHEKFPLSEISAGVCFVKRQHQSSSSSSGSTSSSDAGDVSDDSIEIIHQAQPMDAQFAMKLHSKQRAAESLPTQSSPPPNPSDALHITEPADVPAPPNRADIPGDLRQFSPDDVLWRQSPLFGRTGESGEGRAEEFGNSGNFGQFTFTPRAEKNGAEPHTSPKRTEKYGVGSGTFRTLAHPSEAGREGLSYQQTPLSPDSGGFRIAQSYQGRPRGYSHPPEHKMAPSSPMQDAQVPQLEQRARASSQSDGVPKFQHEDMPIISGNVQGFVETLASTPASQRSHIPSPRSPTISNPPASQQTRLPSPRSPIISTAPASHQSRIPCPRSPTISNPSASPPSHISSSQSPTTGGAAGNEASPSVPLHLMLYHPDEFQVPPAAVGMVTGSSLPQVHVKSDTVMEEKAVIRKGSSGRATPETEQGVGQGGGPAVEFPQQKWQAVPMEQEVFRGRSELSACGKPVSPSCPPPPPHTHTCFFLS